VPMTIEFPVLSDRLSVRPFRDGDATAIHRIYGDLEVMRYVAHGTATSPAESATMVQSYIAHQQAHGYSCWAVADRSSSAIIGDAGFEAREGGAEFGYTLARWAWGRGLATEVGRLCVALAFTELDLPELSGLVDPHNAASIRVLDKLGFRFCGERQAYGRSHHEYVLTVDEWEP